MNSRPQLSFTLMGSLLLFSSAQLIAGDATEVSMRVVEAQDHPVNAQPIPLPERLGQQLKVVQSGLQSKIRQNGTNIKQEFRVNLNNFHEQRRINREQIKSYLGDRRQKVAHTLDRSIERVQSGLNNIKERVQKPED